MNANAVSAAAAAPRIPYGGINRRLSATSIAAAEPVITQLNCVLRSRPIPIATTVYPPQSAPANASGATTSAPGQNASLRASTCTIHGASTPSASDNQEATNNRYVSTNAYVRFASRSSSIEYANAGQAVRNATSSSTIADAMRTPIE